MKFYITFGSDHLDGTGLNKYIVIEAKDRTEARSIAMIEFGAKWAFMYDTTEVIEKHNLKRYVTLELVRTY